MFGVLPIGPYRTYYPVEGQSFPMYIAPFGREGAGTAPATRQAMMDDLAAGGYTDVYVFSHGWNNDWKVATRRYEDFTEGYIGLRKKYGLPVPSPYRPILIGIFWPSTALVTEDEHPLFAGPTDTADVQFAIDELEVTVAEEDRARVRDLLRRPELNEAEASELASVVDRGLDDRNEDVSGASALQSNDWVTSHAEDADDFDIDYVRPAPGAADTPDAAVLGAKKFLPRTLLRLFTVRQMKDRAGVVGARGVAQLLSDIVARAPGARLHLIGHSYGSRLLLSAICFPDEPPARISSLLLLQPAVSHLCFAARIEKAKAAGGYRRTLDRVRAPILATFSKHDVALRQTFHLAVRRKRDLGEAQIAAGEPPSIFAALGGFGPRGAGEAIVDMKDPVERYALNTSARVIGVNGSRTIGGHGKIDNESTWWALYTLAEWNWGQPNAAG